MTVTAPPNEIYLRRLLVYFSRNVSKGYPARRVSIFFSVLKRRRQWRWQTGFIRFYFFNDKPKCDNFEIAGVHGHSAHNHDIRQLQDVLQVSVPSLSRNSSNDSILVLGIVLKLLFIFQNIRYAGS